MNKQINITMLEVIKCSYFYKEIFSYVNDKIKLKLAKYNKDLQNKIDININHYKYFTGKYIIYETNKKGKEYCYGCCDDNKLIYIGEYLNGERNGKGKEYDECGHLIFEGEYLKGKRNGKGKERKGYTKIIFKGEYLNGKRWNGIERGYDKSNGKIFFEMIYLNGKKWNGKIFDNKNNIICELINGNGILKEFDNNNDLTFEGEYKNGERNGKGKEFEQFIKSPSFEGEYLNGKRNGKGREYDKFGNVIFEGIYLNDKRWNGNGYDNKYNKVYELLDGNGHVIEYCGDKIKFEGNYLNGKKHGKLIEYSDEGKILFEGNYSNGSKYGKGKQYDYYGNLKFDGEYLDGKLHGKVKEYINHQVIFDGEYLYDFIIKGRNYLDGKLEYEGDYLYNKKINGKGYDENGNIIYELINGTGKVKEYNIYRKNILNFEGEYLNGKKNGKGKEYDYYGSLEFDGEYLNGKKWNGKGRYVNFSENIGVEYEYKYGKKVNQKYI